MVLGKNLGRSCLERGDKMQDLQRNVPLPTGASDVTENAVIGAVVVRIEGGTTSSTGAKRRPDGGRYLASAER